MSRDKFSYLLFPSFLHMLYTYLSWFQKAHLSPNSRHYWFYEHLTVVHWSKKWAKNWSKNSVLTKIWKKRPSNCYSSFTVWLFSLKIYEKVLSIRVKIMWWEQIFEYFISVLSIVQKPTKIVIFAIFGTLSLTCYKKPKKSENSKICSHQVFCTLYVQVFK